MAGGGEFLASANSPVLIHCGHARVRRVLGGNNSLSRSLGRMGAIGEDNPLCLSCRLESHAFAACGLLSDSLGDKLEPIRKVVSRS
jgi:hypothetical protein